MAATASHQEEPWSDEESPAKAVKATVAAVAAAPAPAASAASRLAPLPVAFDSTSASSSYATKKFAAPSPVLGSKGRTKSDFEAILASGSDPSDEILRSAEYAEWYYSQNPRDPRALAPLPKTNSPARGVHGAAEDRYSPGDGKPPHGRRGPSQGGNAPGASAGGKGALSLDTHNFHQLASQPYAARGGVNFNPYAANVSAYSLPSPGTQFYAQFAPSPMVGGDQHQQNHHQYAGISPSHYAAAAQAMATSNSAGSPPPGHGIGPSSSGGAYGGHPMHLPGGGGSPTDAHDDAAAVAAAQHALQHHAMMMQHAAYYQQHHAAAAYGYGYPSGPASAALFAPGHGVPPFHAPVQLTPYPSASHVGNVPPPQTGGGYYADMMPGGPGAYGGGFGYGGQPAMNVNGMLLPGGADPYIGGMGEARGGRGRGGGRGGDGGRERGGGGGGRGGRGGRGGTGAAQAAGGYAPRSELLERFRATMGVEDWKLEDIEGHAMEFARDQDGSRFIQRMLDDSPPSVVDRLFREIFANPIDLITDVFGNYVLQKLLEVGTHDQLLLVAESLRGQVVTLTLQTYGCRVIQKCIEVMPPRGLDVIVTELQGNVAKCIQDQNGNHVVQKCVEVVPDRCGFIVSAFSGRVKELATHAYGCRVIQCILQHCPAHEKEIFDELLRDIVPLTEDQYGNYVVQHVLQHAPQAQALAVFDALKDHFYRFSVHKFASNVMERMFARCDESQRAYIIDQLTRELDMGGSQKEECVDGKARNPTQLFFMMKDQYANYVVQKLIDICSDDHKRRLMVSTQPYVPALRKFTFGKHMVARLERMKLLPVPTQQQSVLPAQTSTTVTAASSSSTAPMVAASA